MRELREQGHIETEHLQTLCRFQVSSLGSNSEELKKFKLDIIERLYKLDMDQAGRYSTITQGHAEEKA